jgi:hypothetical protein
MKIKSTIVLGGISYYTTTQNRTDQEIWLMSTQPADYGFVTITTSYPTETEFPTPLVVANDQDVNIIWAVQATSNVLYETSDGSADPAKINWAGREGVFSALLPNIPARIVQIPYSVTLVDSSVVSNTITLFLDSAGNLIGGDCNRPSNKAINCSFLKAGSLSNVQNGGAAASFSVTHWDGDNTGDYTVTGSYDCANSTFSSLAITDTGTVSYSYDSGALSPAATGAATCFVVP